MTPLRTSWPKPKRSAPKQRKELHRSKPIARESEKAKARRLVIASKNGSNSGEQIRAREQKTPKIPLKRKRTVAEERAKHEREYGPPGYVEWIHAQPSVASGKGPCVAAHVGNKGAGVGRKADWDQTVPLLDNEHRHELHQIGHESFEAKYDISFEEQILRTQQGWQAHLATLDGTA